MVASWDIGATTCTMWIIEQTAGYIMIVFGPVPSRRLGRSLGINNIPAKTCSYSCIYCQLGPTKKLTMKRTKFYEPKTILAAVNEQLTSLRDDDRIVDYLTFVPDGEPSLDVSLDTEISLLRELDIPIAIISNASLIWDEDVKRVFLDADVVSLKVDAVSEGLWKRVNRPHGLLESERILDGIREFCKEFSGNVITETMLISGVDYEQELEPLAEFLSELSLHKAYIAVPTRPPCEDWVEPANEELLNKAFQIYASKLGDDRVEYLIGYEGNAFSSTGDVVHDLLSITSVHPMRKDAVLDLLDKCDADWDVVRYLVDNRRMVELEYGDHTYFARKLGAVR